jgi:hypothetical protein
MEEQAGRASLTTAKAVYTATMCQAAQVQCAEARFLEIAGRLDASNRASGELQKKLETLRADTMGQSARVQCAEARFLEIAGRLDTSNRANGELQKELETLRAENVAFLVIDAPEEPNFPEARPFLLTGESVDDHVSPKAAEKPRWSSSFNTGKLAASLAWGLYLTGISAVASTRQSRAGVSLGMAGATVLFYPKLFSANQMGPTLARAAGGAIITGIVFALGSRVNLAASRAPLLCGMLPALFAGQMMGRGIEYLF